MNMGQRILQLNSTFQVAPDGAITLYVAQVPPNPNLLTPGPVLLFVVVGGVPSMGKMVTVGTGGIGVQPVQAASALPPSYTRSSPPPAPVAANGGTSKITEQTRRTIGIAVGVGGAAVLGLLIVLAWFIRRRKHKRETSAQYTDRRKSSSASEPLQTTEFVPASSGRRAQGQAPWLSNGATRQDSDGSFAPLWRPHPSPSLEGVWTPPERTSVFGDSVVSLDRHGPVRSLPLPPGAMAPGGEGSASFIGSPSRRVE
ncbi:hypothetical protein FS749_016546 [Ceratobasidium sp. UAMH 11750]|nr:hypothetical protein FS749_016546 [Ceratobasidium sp. UAMH 11750]